MPRLHVLLALLRKEDSEEAEGRLESSNGREDYRIGLSYRFLLLKTRTEAFEWDPWSFLRPYGKREAVSRVLNI